MQAFVDDLVVMRLVAGEATSRPPLTRPTVVPVTEDDFAGWHPPGRPQLTAAHTGVSIPDAGRPKLAPSPDQTEPGLGTGAPSGRGWWLAGLAGAFSALVFSALLLSLSARDIRPGHPSPALPGWQAADESRAITSHAPETTASGPELTRIPALD